MDVDEDSNYFFKTPVYWLRLSGPYILTHFYVYVMIRATSIIPSNYKRVSGMCAFIAFTRAPGIGLKDGMHSSTY